MKRFPILLATMTAVPGIATELHVFSAGQPAKAQEVNDNFQRLDTAIQNRATKASLESTDGALKSVMTTIGTLQTGKAEKSDLDALSAKQKTDAATLAKATVDSSFNIRKSIPAAVDISGKADKSWVRDTLKVKVDTSRIVVLEKTVLGKQAALGFTPANKEGDTFTGDVTMDKTLKVGSMVSAGGFQTGGGIRGSKVTVDTLAAGAITSGTIAFDVLTSTSASGSSMLPGHYYSLNYMETADGPTSFVHYYPNGFSGLKPTFGHLRAYNPAGKDKYNVLIVGGWNDANSLQWRVGGNATYVVANSGNFKEMASNNGIVMNTGGTISGDLKITGKLTTPPGATPADYVFEPDYQLMSLSEVEAFTKVNKHLPEVPSAKEMTENGVDMAAMNMVLLKKVEELTLHAIALQKAMDEQKTQLEQRLQRLESKQNTSRSVDAIR